ncbi:MAG: 50S ribosomal protein L25 [Planctomycetes bacterium]|nr:50S ribosomal protein L25 [Planctomycetota bacterium]MCP4838044.1 50S ribosomal protein L25 [Planctomycetota bacterium]
MGHTTPTIEVATRERTGTRYAKRLRDAGRLPAVIYGRGGEPSHVSVDALQAIDHLRQGVHIMDVCVDGGKKETCLIKELQFGHLGDDLAHIDFARVDLDQIVTVKVPVNLFGTAKGTKEDGAMLVAVRSEIEVRCKARDIPSEIKADINELTEALTIGDLDLPDGVEPVLDSEKHIAHIAYKAVEEADADAEAADVDADGSGPEVITEKKEEGAGGEE